MSLTISIASSNARNRYSIFSEALKERYTATILKGVDCDVLHILDKLQGKYDPEFLQGKITKQRELRTILRDVSNGKAYGAVTPNKRYTYLQSGESPDEAIENDLIYGEFEEKYKYELRELLDLTRATCSGVVKDKELNVLLECNQLNLPFYIMGVVKSKGDHYMVLTQPTGSSSSEWEIWAVRAIYLNLLMNTHYINDCSTGKIFSIIKKDLDGMMYFPHSKAAEIEFSAYDLPKIKVTAIHRWLKDEDADKLLNTAAGREIHHTKAYPILTAVEQSVIVLADLYVTMVELEKTLTADNLEDTINALIDKFIESEFRVRVITANWLGTTEAQTMSGYKIVPDIIRMGYEARGEDYNLEDVLSNVICATPVVYLTSMLTTYITAWLNTPPNLVEMQTVLTEFPRELRGKKFSLCENYSDWFTDCLSVTEDEEEKCEE